MPRYINEDDFCEYIRKNTTPSGAEWFISKIKDMPSADVVEVKHGHWLDTSNGWMCSICDSDSKSDTNFCPNCGAKMLSKLWI